MLMSCLDDDGDLIQMEVLEVVKKKKRNLCYFATALPTNNQLNTKFRVLFMFPIMS